MDFSQGNLPSCQTLAAIGALMTNDSGLECLQRMISKVDDGYEVRFPAHPQNPITVLRSEYQPLTLPEDERLDATRAIELIKPQFTPGYFWLAFPVRPNHVSIGNMIVIIRSVSGIPRVNSVFHWRVQPRQFCYS
jgi:hypothetical protein